MAMVYEPDDNRAGFLYINLVFLSKIITKFNNNNTQNLGLLRIISFRDTDIYTEQFNSIQNLLSEVNIKYLNPELYQESKYQAAAIIVSLYRKEWQDRDIVTISKYTVELIEEHPRVIERILYMIENNQFSQKVRKMLLQQLHKMLPKSKSKYLSQIDKFIYDSLANNTSNLKDAATWSKLGFPESSNALLPE